MAEINFIVNGYKLHGEEAGSPKAFPVILIHAFPFNHQMWRPQIDALGNSFRIIAYDVRGHGQSAVGDGQYSLEFLVDDLIGLMDRLKIGKAVLCGLSMGGYVALRAVERHPDRVGALVLSDTRSEADSNETKIKRAAAMKAIKEEGVNAYGEAFLKGALSPETPTKRTMVLAASRMMIQGNFPAGLCGILLAMASRTDTTESLSKIKVPTLIMVGEHDAITPQDAAQGLHDKIADSELQVIPGAGHVSNLENPEVFNKHLFGFLKKWSKQLASEAPNATPA